MNKFIFRFLPAGMLLSLWMGMSAPAQSMLQDTNQFQPGSPDIWRDGIGSGFNSYTYSIGAMAGVGFGTKVFGSVQDHDLAMANVNASWIFPELWPQRRFGGNVELRGELFGGGEFSPEDRYISGFTAMLRYDFVTHSRWVPYVDAGFGCSSTDIGRPDLGQNFEFNLQGGFGTYYFVRKDLALSVEWRWLHFSDAGSTTLNYGVNTQMIDAGITRFF